MRFSDEFINELKARTRLSDVIGRKVRLTRRGKDFVGLSPFSNEKTPSFYVHDDRGFYKCFSSQKAGDAITFLMETERLSFAEAVEKLALEAGLALPSASPEAAQSARRLGALYQWLERATVWFERQLASDAGSAARSYLERRGFGADAQRRHRLGYAPAGWRTLSDALTGEGARLDELVEAGLLVPAEDGRAPWDRFRNRIIFPISDPQGRVTAFGARTLDPDGKPKYLNSPESPLFHKGRSLYRYGPAREALARLDQRDPLGRGLVVAEGYVDAIALAEAGLGGATAPLGTALTEEQIELLWRAGPEPILCFDGDSAGLRAAYRAVDRALPMIEPGRTLYFALLPEGMDPDDVIRVRGADDMRRILEAAAPLVDILWKREVEAQPCDTPERRAGLEARLAALVARIQRSDVRKAYEREIKDRLFSYFRTIRGASDARSGDGRPRAPAAAGVARARLGVPGGAIRRSGLGLLIRIIESPDIFEQVREPLLRAVFPDPDVAAVRDAAFDVADSGQALDRTAVAAHLRSLGRSRAVRMLEEEHLGEHLLRSETGQAVSERDWRRALEQYAEAAAIREEAKSVLEGMSAETAFTDADQERRMKLVLIERRNAGRFDFGATDGGSGGVNADVRSVLDELGSEMGRRSGGD
jgi:DNA primase